MPQSNSIFEQIISFPMLCAGWQKVKARRGARGGDGTPWPEFDRNADKRLAALRDALISGDYWPTCTLRIPSIADRIVQSAATIVLTPVLDREFEDASFGYRPGRSVQQAVARVAAIRNAGYTWTVDGDIETFFDEVPHAPLLDLVDRTLGCPKTTDLIERWLTAYCDNGRGLPQGMPVSPVLSNLYLDGIDEKIEKDGVRLVRFADDFVLLCRSEHAAEGALSRMTDLLRKAGLRINPDKTAIRRFEDSTRFLGHLFVRGLVMEDNDDQAEVDDPPHAVLAPEPARAEAPTDTVPESLHAPRLRWIYVHEPGRVITARGNGFSVLEDADGPEIALAHPGWADGIEVGPGAKIDDAALRLALEARMPVVFVGSDGALDGTLDPAPADRAALHLAQARLVLDPEAQVDMVRRLVRGRIVNQRRTLMRLNAKRDIDSVVARIDDMRPLVARLPAHKTVDGLRGLEGHATAHYWRAIRDLLDPALGFRQRKRRPPPDPVNLAISYLATRLAADMHALILRHGLHPGFACLHASQDGRASLALDLIEEFRAPLVEGTVVTLFRQGRLKPEGFIREPEGTLRSDSHTIAAMIKGYESRLRTSLDNPSDGRRTNWRGLMEAQVLSYIRHCRGDGEFECHERER